MAAEQIDLGIAWRAAHQVGFCRLKRQGQRQGHGGDHIDPENLQRGDRQGQAQGDGRQQYHRFAAIGGQDKQDGLLQVVIDRAAFLDRMGDGGEVVVGQYHLRGFLGRLSALDAHGDADVCAFQGRRVVDAVAGHGHPRAAGLQAFNQAQFVRRAGAGEHAGGG